MINQKVIPNIYVFNSLMNVNAHDLGYTLQIYRDIRVNLSLSLTHTQSCLVFTN
uniref:Uncharacterized protein n=1 Tax=Rhizophora mucronata TaxID=61149 RepID=A0A2P2LLS5_RHIMU